MGMKCVSCATEKKKRTAELQYQGDTLCLPCFHKKMEYQLLEAENNRKMREIEAKLEALTGAKK